VIRVDGGAGVPISGVGLIYYKQSETVAMLGRNFVEYGELLAE
jgi:hypothetical protein